MARVLFISYHFPPSGGAKTRRLVKFLKHLPHSDWFPVVLTARTRTGFGHDATLLKEIPTDVPVYRTFDAYSLLKKWLLNGRVDEGSEADSRRRTTARRWGGRTLSALRRWIAIPDAFLFTWGPFALIEGIRTVRRERIALLFATGPPFSSLIVGACLKQISKRPLVLDCRDAWTANPARRMKYAGARGRIESRLEAFVMRRADVIVCTTEGITDDFRRRYAHQRATTFITVPNGYDRDEHGTTEPAARAPGGKMRIVHTGRLSHERSPEPLLQAMRQLFDAEPTLQSQIELHLVGDVDRFRDGRTIHNYLRDLRLESAVTLPGHVPHREAVRYQVSADLLVLIIGVVPPEEQRTYGVASKVFDYMLATRPVLTIADPGAVRDLVERTQLGPAFATSDIAGIQHYLRRALRAFQAGTLHVQANSDEIARYDVRNLTRELVEQCRHLARS